MHVLYFDIVHVQKLIQQNTLGEMIFRFFLIIKNAGGGWQLKKKC